MESSRPIAYLVTLRTFGTWLHGDARGSHHRLHRTYGTPPLPGRPRLEAVERLQARAPARLLDARSRVIVERVASDVCAYHGWDMLAGNARTNHLPLGRCDGRRAGGLGAQPQIVANAQAGGGRGATSQDPALVEAREHCIPLDGPLSRPGGALPGARSRRRAKRDLTN